jgi:hypothetical protein
MEIEKKIDITVKIDLDDKDICEWIEERINDLDILMTDEAKEKMKPLKAKYYEKWMELYWFFQNPHLELKGKDPMPESSRQDAKNYFL